MGHKSCGQGRWRPRTTVLPLLPTLWLAACGDGVAEQTTAGHRIADGNPAQGRTVLAAGAYGCGGCHAIPGIRGARGSIGPPLHGMALRAYVAGRVPNRPDRLVDWIVDPRRIDPLSAMPATGIGRDEAIHVAAYLYTLRDLPE